MGQKVHPYGFRLGFNRNWKARWYVNPKEYRDTLLEDLRLRKFLKAMPEVQNASVGNIEIFRQPARILVVLSTARPGFLIGTKGGNMEVINEKTQKFLGKSVDFKVNEIKKPDLDAQVVALGIARQIKMRMGFRRVVKQALSNVLKAGAQGVKIKVGGRLDGAEIARDFELKNGKVPLHTLKADIDYGFAEAFTTYGVVGVKVWIYKGDLLSYVEDNQKEIRERPNRHANVYKEQINVNS